MIKKKAIKETWCPLTGDTGYPKDLYFSLIERAREHWGVRNIVYRYTDGSYTGSVYMPSNSDFKKAREIYEAWMNLPDSHDRLEALCFADAKLRPYYVDDLVMAVCMFNRPYFYKFTAFEVLTIIAIAEAKKNMDNGINGSFPFELIEIAGNYNPDAIRGRKVVDGARKSGNARRSQVKEKRFEVWENCHKIAEEIWKNNPALSKLRVAILIRKKLEEKGIKISANTIRQRIKKNIT